MYSFTPDMEKSIQAKAKDLIGQTFKYKQLCEALDIHPVAHTNTCSKNKQLRDLANLIEYEEVPAGKQKAYLIVSVYDNPKLAYYDTDERYNAFKSQLFEILDKPWFTRTSLLYELGMINDNFRVLLNTRKRHLVEEKYERSFYNESKFCKIIGGVLADKAYNALDRMKREGLIRYEKGYAIAVKLRLDDSEKAWKKDICYIPVPPDDEKDPLYQLIKKMDEEIAYEIDDESKAFTSEKSSHMVRINKPEMIINGNYKKFQKKRKERITSDDTGLLEMVKQKNDKVVSIVAILDVRFITPLVDSVAAKPNAKAIINKCAIECVLSTKDKRLNRFEGLRKGFPDGYICLQPKDNYRRIVSSQEEKKKAEKENSGAFKKKFKKTVYDPYDDELDDDFGF